MRHTSAALSIRPRDIPFAKLPNDPVEQGTIAIPLVLKEPLAILAPTSFSSITSRRFPSKPYLSARIFGMSINRILDVNIDKKNPRTKKRGLIIGSITLKAALFISLLSLLIFYTTLIYFDNLALLLSPIVIAVFIIYPLTKRFTYADDRKT